MTALWAEFTRWWVWPSRGDLLPKKWKSGVHLIEASQIEPRYVRLRPVGSTKRASRIPASRWAKLGKTPDTGQSAGEAQQEINDGQGKGTPDPACKLG